MTEYRCMQCNKVYHFETRGQYTCTCINQHYPEMGHIVLVEWDIAVTEESLL